MTLFEAVVLLLIGWATANRRVRAVGLLLRWDMASRIKAQIPGIPSRELYLLLGRMAGLIGAFDRVNYDTIVVCQYTRDYEYTAHFRNSIANLRTRSVIMDFDGDDPDLVYCVGFGYGEVCYEEERFAEGEQ